MDKKYIEAILKKARELIELGETEEAHSILKPLEKINNPEALFLLSLHLGFVDENNIFHENPKWIDYLKKSAEAGHPEAIYQLGYQYDIGGEFPVDSREQFPKDKKKAAQLFKRAADLGDPHSLWIHGEDLLYGRNGIEEDAHKGIDCIEKAAGMKFEGAVLSMIEFYETGAFGFPKDLKKANIWRRKLSDDDLISY
jgi:TPR repeat protein